jgi:hypothetical protein
LDHVQGLLLIGLTWRFLLLDALVDKGEQKLEAAIDIPSQAPGEEPVGPVAKGAKRPDGPYEAAHQEGLGIFDD